MVGSVPAGGCVKLATRLSFFTARMVLVDVVMVDVVMAYVVMAYLVMAFSATEARPCFGMLPDGKRKE